MSVDDTMKTEVIKNTICVGRQTLCIEMQYNSHVCFLYSIISLFQDQHVGELYMTINLKVLFNPFPLCPDAMTLMPNVSRF